MEHGACNLVYVDQRTKERTIRRNSTASNEVLLPNGVTAPDYFKPDGGKQEQEIQSTLDSLLSIFATVQVFSSGTACLAKLAEIDSSGSDSIPTLVLIDVPYDEEANSKRWSREARTPSPTFSRGLGRIMTGESLFDTADIYGARLLAHIASEIQFKKFSKLLIPIAVVSGFERDWAPANIPSPSVHGSQVMSDSVRLTRFIDVGAVDVMTSPVTKANVQSLAMHAYRTYREVSRSDHTFMAAKRNRKMSWVGVDDEKPYAYLREAMVSNLMAGICSPESEPDLVTVTISTDPLPIDPSRREAVREAVGSWSFSAHDLNDDELLYAALVMLEHALTVPELEPWKISTTQLIPFLEACQNAYNSFVHYHNFRHAVDVMQGVFFFLLQLNVLPHFQYGPKLSHQSPVASLLQPFDALALLVSAIGHDVGHPGVNNAFLVQLNAPLAQLYNDRSVLESFHCAAYSQILRRHWPSVFKDTTLRKLMINIILATDMGLHFKYMQDLKVLQEKINVDDATAATWDVKDKDATRDLVCGLLIKCADISNVARPFLAARKWADILTEEFANQGTMEAELGIPTCLFGGPPILNDISELAKSQQGFINIFASPLFSSVSKVLPSLSFSIDEMSKNNAIWEQKKASASDTQLSGSDATSKAPYNESNTPETSLSRETLANGVGSTFGPQNKSLSDPEIFGSRLAAGSIATTATALPLLQQLGPDATPATTNGIDMPNVSKESKSPPKSLKLFAKSPNSSSPTSALRAASAHHPRTKVSPRGDSTQVNGTNPTFAASETNVRYLGNGGIHKNSPHDQKTVHLSHHTEGNGDTEKAKNKRLTQSIKNLWKRRWHTKSTQNLRECHDEVDGTNQAKSLVSPTTTLTSEDTHKIESGTS